MNRLFKTLLLWLLVAMLPLHAVGAAMPMSCTPAHHQAMQKATHHASHQTHGQHQQHQQHHAGMAMDGHHPDASVADGSTSHTHQHAGCSACDAGCIGATAPPVTWLGAPASSGSEAVLLSPSPLLARHTPSDLERPPKSILA